MFSVQLDITQDASSKYQVYLALRYVDKSNVVKERLFLPSLTEMLPLERKNNLFEHNIDISVCVGDSSDGASNMQGVYKGFSTILSAEAKFCLDT